MPLLSKSSNDLTSNNEHYGTSIIISSVFVISVPFLWIYLIGALRTISDTSFDLSQALFCLGLGGGLIFCAVLSRKWQVIPNANRSDIPVACILSALAIFLCFEDILSDNIRNVILCLGGIALAWMVLRTFVLCCRFDFITACSLILIAFAIGSTIRLLLYLLTLRNQIIIVAILLAIASPLSFFILRHLEPYLDTNEHNHFYFLKQNQGANIFKNRSHIAFFIEIIVSGLALGIFMFYVVSPIPVMATIINYILCISAALFILYLLRIYISQKSVYITRIIFFIIIAILLTLTLLGGKQTSSIMTYAISTMMRNLMLIVIYLIALQIAFNDNIYPIIVISILRGSYEIAQGIGILLNSWLNISNLSIFTSSNVLFLICILIAILAINRITIFIGLINRPKDIKEIYDFDTRCNIVGNEYNLTKREIEILKLMCQNATQGDVAQTLGISVNTVRWHCQHIYEKLNIHSKQELFKLLNRQ